MPGHLHLASNQHRGGPRERIRIVLADGHEAVRRSLRLLLEHEHDLDVIAEASDASVAVDRVLREQPEVLVVDLRRHYGWTLATIRELRAHAPTTDIVVVTMEASASYANQALAAGAGGFVLKECADSDLPGAIRAVARGGEFVSRLLRSQLTALRSRA